MPKFVSPAIIQFHFLERGFTLSDRIKLKAFLARLFKKEHTPLSSLNYIFCSDEYLLKINKDFLGHDYYTDIITFDLSANGEPVVAEIYVSVDRVKENSKLLKEPFYKELHRVMFHGALHLCGYNDKKKAEKLAMRENEDIYLGLYFN
jgi:probable rRNA maturation factor